MFIAETEIEVSHGQTGRTFPVRFTYTVTKPRPASRTEPAETAAVEITGLEVRLFGGVYRGRRLRPRHDPGSLRG